MEGSFKAVKIRNCGGVRSWRPLAILLRNACIISLAVAFHAYSQTFDVLIVQRPDHLVAYDAFQQSLTSQQESAIPPFVPIRILKNHDVLSDGLTPCTKVEVEGEVFYLLLNDRGQLAGSKDLGLIRVFRHARAVDDTIEVIDSKHAVFQDPIRRSGRRLSTGERCVCLFEAEGAVYARRVESKSDYGWLTLPKAEQGKWWRVVHVQPAHVDLSPMIRDRLVERIDDVNLAYTEVYDLLGKESGKKLPVPQWNIESTATSMTCVLRPAIAAPFYRQSIRLLTATLQTYLIGTGFDVVAEGNTIQIVKR